MPIAITAKEGEGLCVIAMQNGFLNCQPLRDEPKNAAFLGRPLRDGDVVTVPDLGDKHESCSTCKTHSFVKLNALPVSIRYVPGSADDGSPGSQEVLVLNVSNYPTDKGGSRAEAPFPKDFGYHQEGHADPDAFKIEVVDPAATGSRIMVTLEPLMPIYNVVNHKLVVVRHDRVPEKSTMFVECAAIASTPNFRSKYLRIVTHDEDNASVPEQTLVVVSPADGKGTGKPGDRDNIEILDFEIRANYTIPKCPAAFKCKVSVTRPLGDESEKRRFRIAFHIFKKRDTGAPVGGLTAQKVRFRALRDLRAYYAQASMAPKLVSADGSNNGPAVIFMPEPDNNMIVIGETTGQGASTHGDHGKKSTLTISDAALGDIATVNFTHKMKPHHVALAIQDALDELTFKVELFKNPKAQDNARHNSWDVLITRIDGTPLDLTVRTDDTLLRNNITVARVDIDAIDPYNNPLDARRVFRSSPGPAGAINVYAVGHILGSKDDPFSHPAAFSTRVRFTTSIVETQARQIADSVLCEARWLDENEPVTDVLPHECGHILGKVGHIPKGDPHLETEMMNPHAHAPSEDEPNSTRISDFPVLVNYEVHDDVVPVRLINAVNRFTTSRTDLLENW